jgi:hypothetical protein
MRFIHHLSSRLSPLPSRFCIRHLCSSAADMRFSSLGASASHAMAISPAKNVGERNAENTEIPATITRISDMVQNMKTAPASRPISIELSVDMIEEVFAEYERDNPGKSFQEMDATDVADRVMKKMFASAKFFDN